jgi:heme/copper-type cytochrome/quinol oxidase subunit 2
MIEIITIAIRIKILMMVIVIVIVIAIVIVTVVGNIKDDNNNDRYDGKKMRYQQKIAASKVSKRQNK